MLVTFKLTNGGNTAINPEQVVECFGDSSTTRIITTAGTTDVEGGFEETITKLNEASLSKGLEYLIDATGVIACK